MTRRVFLLCLASSVSSGLSGCHERPRDGSGPRPGLEWPEADLLFQRDRSWVGGDGASSIDLGNGRILWLFGDSWIDPEGTGSREEAVMISNALALQRGHDPSLATAAFFWRETPDGEPGAFFPDFDGGRYWPGHGLRIEDRLLLFLMEVHLGGEGLGFEVTGWKAVLVANPDDDPPHWVLEWLDTPANSARIIIGSGSVLSRGDFVYAFGAREPGPRQQVYLVRWTTQAVVEGRLGDMEWWGGDRREWIPDGEGALGAAPVFSDGQTEFTVHYDDDAGSFLEFQTSGFGDAVVVRRTSPALTGPWSPPDTVFIPPQTRFPRIMIYQGKAHPHLEGAGLVLTYCTNSFDFADHIAEAWLYFPRFVRMEGSEP